MKTSKKLTPDFIIVPYTLILDDKLTNTDKIVFGAVYYFSNMRGKSCFATNSALAQLASTSVMTIGKSLQRLEDRGYIIRTYFDPETKHSRKEILMLLDKKGHKKNTHKGSSNLTNKGIVKNDVPDSQNLLPPVVKNDYPIKNIIFDEEKAQISQEITKNDGEGVVKNDEVIENIDRKMVDRKNYLVPSGPTNGEKTVNNGLPISSQDGLENGNSVPPEISEKSWGAMVNDTIALFLKIFPGDFVGTRTAFSKPPTREAVEALMQRYTTDQIKKLIDKYASGESDPYRPQVGTVYEFCTFKLAKVEAYAKKTSGMYYNRPLGSADDREKIMPQREAFLKKIKEDRDKMREKLAKNN